MPLNCGVGEDWESLGLQGDPTSPFRRRSALGFLWKEWCESWNSSTLATSCEELTHWKSLWCREGLGQEEKGTTKDEMGGWHHWLDGRESEWTPGVGDGQGGLACCDSWGHKESDTTERLIWSDYSHTVWPHVRLIRISFTDIAGISSGTQEAQTGSGWIKKENNLWLAETFLVKMPHLTRLDTT